MALIMARDARVRLDGNRLSDHARSPVEESVERIENTVRTARGRMRKNYIADKLSFSISWTRLPGPSDATVDGHWGAENIIQFYRGATGELTLDLENADGTQETYTVVFTDFSYSVTHRYDRYYYDISLSLEEV